jgi:Ca-activated chloride channel family protein
MFDHFSAFHFLRPQWLWAALTAPILYVLVHRQEDVLKRWKQIIAPELLKELLVGRHRRWRLRPVHATALTILLAAIAVAGPTWTREQPPFTEDKAPLIIALDLSREMDAIDVQPTRLERAKLKIRDILKLRQGSRTALFVYGADAHMVLPLTTDAALLDLYLEALSTDLIHPGPKDTAAALRVIDTFNKNESVPGTILFITYGVERKAFPAFVQHGNTARDQVLVLGIGTAQGGPLRTPSGQFLTENGHRVFSRLDLDGLKALKDQAGTPVSTTTLDDDDIKWVQRHALSHLKAVQQSDAKVRWVDQGYWLVIPIALFTALWFRKGWTIRWVTGLLLLILFRPENASAAGFRFADLWLTPDQQGRYYFEKGDYGTAAERFEDPMWKGLALCRERKYDEAISSFALMNTAESWFNQGNALAYQKKYPEAVNAYNEALKMRPHWREAEDNLAVVRSLIPPPKKPDEQQYDPTFKPDQFKFDEKGKKGKKGALKIGKEQTADIWMRNIQVSPADFLRRKFAIEAAEKKRP